MKVFAFLKINGSDANPEGDIISFHRLSNDINTMGRDALNYFVPVVVDINVPCDSDFGMPHNKCVRCEWSTPDDCDVVKYTRGAWSTGDLDNPPRVIRKCKHRIDFQALLSKKTIENLRKTGKTEGEMHTILENALNNEQLSSVIEEK